MPFSVDDRIGSGELLRPLKRIGLPARKQRLEFGDFAFTGNGPNGDVRIGVERKTVLEIITAIHDSRFTGRQLPGLLRTYDHVWLIVEGYVRPDPTSGVLMRGKWELGYGKDRHLYENFAKFQITIQAKARLFRWPTTGKDETVQFLSALYRWYQKPWKDHRSVYTVDETKPDAAILSQRTLKRQILAQLPGVGWHYSARVDKYFDTLHEAFNADARQWQRALGFKAGTETARKIVECIHAADTEEDTQHVTPTRSRFLRNPTPLR